MWCVYSYRCHCPHHLLALSPPFFSQGMTSCQLSTRLWEIDGADGYHRCVPTRTTTTASDTPNCTRLTVVHKSCCTSGRTCGSYRAFSEPLFFAPVRLQSGEVSTRNNDYSIRHTKQPGPLWWAGGGGRGGGACPPRGNKPFIARSAWRFSRGSPIVLVEQCRLPSNVPVK